MAQEEERKKLEEIERERLAMPHVLPKEAKTKIEEASKETGVRTDTTKENADLNRRVAEAQKEAEQSLALTRGVKKKKK